MNNRVKKASRTEPTDVITIPTMHGYELKFNPKMMERVLAGEALLVGADVGYGVTKLLSWGFDPVLLKTIYGYGRDLGYQEAVIFAQHPGESIEVDNGTMFVGDLAASQLPQREQMSLWGREDADDIRVLMILAALAKMFPDVYREEPIYVRMATGLPVDHMGGAAALKTALIGRKMVHTSHCKFPVEIQTVSVMPQPSGTISAYSLNPDGTENPAYTISKLSVIDNGKRTVDISTEEEGLYVDAESGTTETGMHTAFERIAQRYEEEFGQKPKDKIVERILLDRGKFKARGEEQDWSDEVEEALWPMRDATIGLARTKLERAIEQDVILNIGGPAPLVKDLIRQEYRQAIMPASSQLTNALGYLHYGAFVAMEEG
jgi:hypothetical protein